MVTSPIYVYSSPGAFVSFMGTNLPNHSYVDLTLVGDAVDGSDSVQCHTDLDTCCSRSEGADRGDWYFPNGTRLTFTFYGGDIGEWRLAQRVDLRHRNNAATSGIYRCTIETNAVNNEDGRETVYVGLYASGGECAHGEEFECSQ